MLFSEAFQINRGSEDDWFDLILDTDTPLFVDPFLIFKDTREQWRTAHDQLIGHFDTCFHLIAGGNRNTQSLSYKKAIRLLTFPEPREFCLGYTESGTKGAGGGEGYARTIAEAMVAAIERGLTSLKHFEELGVLNEGIGPDRVSDVTCNVLRSRFIVYTKEVAARHGIPTVETNVGYASYNSERRAWASERHDLPRNPYSDKPILLVPQRFLRRLQVLNPADWWDYYETERVKDDLNYEVMHNVNKRSIVAAARSNPEMVRKWTTLLEQQATPDAYDLESDPSGVYKWDAVTRRYVETHPLTIPPPEDDATFFDVIEQVIAEFKHFIEEQGGWKLLWNDGNYKDKHEEAIQLAFLGIARSYCRANNVMVDREVELGRGPVDFKFSNGYTQRALLEVKKLHNGKFWNGLEKQLPSYLHSDDCHDGWFLSVQYKGNRTSVERSRRLPDVVSTVAVNVGKNLRLRTVDATPKASASTL